MAKNLEPCYNQIDVLLKDNVIGNWLKKVPSGAKTQIIKDALTQTHVSDTFDTAIFAIPSYLSLCQRINKLINIRPVDLKIQSSPRQLSAINKAFDIASLTFSIKGLEEFAALKEDKAIRHYAHSFREFIKELPNGELDQCSLYKAMAEACNKDEISSKISGGFGISSTITGLISLIPIVGTIGGIIGLAEDASSRITNKVSENNKWWLLASEVSKRLTKSRIEKLAK